MNNIFSKSGSLLLAGAFALTFASCDTDTRSNQSTVREAENQYETETNTAAEVNEPTLSYENGEFQGGEENTYDYDRAYGYEERDVVIDRVRNDLDRAETSLQELGERMEREGAQASEDVKREWEETRQNLEVRRQELDQDLQNLERSTEDNWENVRNDANESLRGFEQEWEGLRNRSAETMEENDVNLRNHTKADYTEGDEATVGTGAEAETEIE